MAHLLEVDDLTTEISTKDGKLTAVDGVSFWLDEGEAFGLVGESGSGKSMTCRSILRLLPGSATSTRGTVQYRGNDLLKLSEHDMALVRGKEVSMIFQDPVVTLNPVLRIGRQIAEGLLEHRITSRSEARARALEMMKLVGIPDPERRINDYPHQFSGGMCQRVLIAAALACRPKLILADEPTTQLDVTVQDQILKLLRELQAALGASMILVTHNLGVVAQTCQRVAVMYAGQIVELASTEDLFMRPKHPYTIGLMNCIPRLGSSADRRVLKPIPGQPPNLVHPPSGCRFRTRCPLATEECSTTEIELRNVGTSHLTACIHHELLNGTQALWNAANDDNGALQDE